MPTDDEAPKKREPKIDVNVPRSPEQDRAALKRKVGIFYDLQRLRLQTAGRTYKRADGTEIQLHEVDVAVLERRTKELHLAETHALRDVEDHLKTIAFYNEVLSDKTRYKGVGPTMAGVILSSFDIRREDTASKMWAFAGLRPMPARRCKLCHSVLENDGSYFKHRKERARGPVKPGVENEPKLPKCMKASSSIPPSDTYESGQAQRPTKGEKLPYNAFLRSKLCGVLGPVLLKLGSPWKKQYDDYKHRKATAGWGKSDAHRHAAAIRYMIKMLLLDIHKEWRTHLGLPVRPSYHEEYQGHVHSGRSAEEGGAPTGPTTIDSSYDAEIEAELENVG